MKDYRKMSCAKCGEPFDDKSDVVVCPECGAPHHRECWNESGSCAFEDRHADGYEWQPEKMYIGDVTLTRDNTDNATESGQDELVICPQCGKRTHKNLEYCEYCGYYRYEQTDSFSEKDSESNLDELFPFDPAETIKGVPAGDIKRFVGNMWIYYIPRFLRMSRSNSPVSFNFTACFAHGFWFVSRGMYLPGILMILTVISSTLYQSYLASIVSDLSGNQLAIGSMVSMLFSGLELVIMIVSGLFGNRLYMNFCAKKVKRINAEVSAKNGSAEDFNIELQEKGGLSMIPALSMILCYLAILYISEKGILF